MTAHDTHLSLAVDRHTYTPDEPRSVLNAIDLLTMSGYTTDQAEHIAWLLYHAKALA